MGAAAAAPSPRDPLQCGGRGVAMKTKIPAAGMRQGLGISVWTDNQPDTAAPNLFQHHVDCITLLAARSRVDPSTVKAQLLAWGLAVVA